MYFDDSDYLKLNSHAFKDAEFNWYLVQIQDGGHFQNGGGYQPTKSIFPIKWLVLVRF
jgi:hypothetical protein